MNKNLRDLFLLAIAMVSLNTAFAQETGNKVPAPAGLIKKQIPAGQQSLKSGLRAISCDADTIVYPYLKELVFAAPFDSFFVDAMVGNVRTASQAYHLGGNVNVLGVQFWGGAYSTSPAPQTLQVRAYLYSVDAFNMPVTKLDSADMTITNAYDYYEAVFATPHAVSGNFAVAVRSVPNDTLAVITNNADNVWSTTNYGESLAWRRFGSGVWNSTLSFFGQDLEYMIFPIVDYQVTASATASDTEICEGAAVNFTNTSSDLFTNRMFNLYAFDAYWDFADADSAFSWNYGETAGWTGTVDGLYTYNNPGTYEVKLAGEMLGYYNSCSDTATFEITVNETYATTANMTICEGETYLFGSAILSVAGTYTEPFSSVAGCDSVVTLTLNVTTIDTGITTSGTTMTSDMTGATYQWLDCGAIAPISGANGQSYTATTNGEYAVIVTSGTCVDTSACTTISSIGINENMNLAGLVSLYPNPSEGLIHVRSNGVVADNITVTNVVGEVVYTARPVSNITTIDLRGNSQAVYFVTVKYKGAARTFKVLSK